MLELVEFESYEKSVPELLNKVGFKELLKKNKKKIILKPNLTCNKEFPTTTNVKFVEEIIKYIREFSEAKILIAEGSGGNTAEECFEDLGYKELAEKFRVGLVDLNETETIEISKAKFKKFKIIEYPKIPLDSFLISLPVLKEHHEAIVTISLKNMLGAFPSKYYKSPLVGWKDKIHSRHIDYRIHDILTCKFPDFAICDASTGQVGGEVHGEAKKFNLLLAGSPLEVDKKGAEILGYDWKKRRYLVFASELVES